MKKIVRKSSFLTANKLSGSKSKMSTKGGVKMNKEEYEKYMQHRKEERQAAPEEIMNDLLGVALK